MRRAALLVLGFLVAFGAVAGFAVRQDRNVMFERRQSPGAESAPRWRSAFQHRDDMAPRAQRAERRDRQGIGGWNAVQLGLDALNALFGLVGIVLAWKGLRGRRNETPAQRAANQTPARIRPSPTT